MVVFFEGRLAVIDLSVGIVLYKLVVSRFEFLTLGFYGFD